MKKRNAFTIIEVVLVLAIAGLIFLMVFIALPALQRSQRNTRRRQDVSRIASALTSYYSSNNKMPFYKEGRYQYFDYGFIKNYVESNIVMPDVNPAKMTGDLTVSCMEGKDCNEFSDPNGSVYGVAIVDTTEGLSNDSSNMNKIIFTPSSKCGSEKTIKLGDGDEKSMFAVSVMLEGGSLYCVDNS